jgi:hypothetical protein
MPKFLITFMASGGITIEAETEEEAREKFENIPVNLLMDELESNGIEQTDIFQEDEIDLDDYSGNMPCDNTGYCSPGCRKFGSSCEH